MLDSLTGRSMDQDTKDSIIELVLYNHVCMHVHSMSCMIIE